MKSLIAALCGGLILSLAGAAFAEPLATVVALRGNATVERGAKKLDAQTKLGIELQDTVATAEGGRVKMLFIDDSVLTLAEKSRMSVNTFVHSRSDRGKSLFNLLDGKMRAVVGKTRFEVQTPTVVAAARGTVILFDVGTQNGKAFTRVTCLEGIVDIRSVTAPPGAKPVMLSPGQSIVVAAKLPAAEQKSSASEQKSATTEQKSTEVEEKTSTSEQKSSTTEQKSTPVEEKAPTTEQKSSTPEQKPVAVEEALPAPVQLSPIEINQLKQDTNTPEVILPPPTPPPLPPPAPPVIILPPKPPVIPQQPVVQPKSVTIGVKF
jgi:hypothetical protein